jgi:hypothetical protein
MVSTHSLKMKLEWWCKIMMRLENPLVPITPYSHLQANLQGGLRKSMSNVPMYVYSTRKVAVQITRLVTDSQIWGPGELLDAGMAEKKNSQHSFFRSETACSRGLPKIPAFSTIRSFEHSKTQLTNFHTPVFQIKCRLPHGRHSRGQW